MNKMDKKEAKALIAKFARNLPLSAMSLCYLFERGSAQVMNTSEEEYSAAVDAEIAKAEANGGIYLLSKETALKVLRWATGFTRKSIWRRAMAKGLFLRPAPARIVAPVSSSGMRTMRKSSPVASAASALPMSLMTDL